MASHPENNTLQSLSAFISINLMLLLNCSAKATIPLDNTKKQPNSQ
jgi:hypothetical protein